MTLAERLQDRNISEIARKTGISRATLYKVRRGEKVMRLVEKVLEDYLNSDSN